MKEIEKVAEKLMERILSPEEVIVKKTNQRSRRYLIMLKCKDGNRFIRLKKNQAANLMGDLMEYDELTYCGENQED